MSNTKTLAQNALALAKSYRSVLQLAEFVEGIGSLEQARDEAESIAAEAQASADEAKASREEAVAELEKVKAELGDKRKEAKEVIGRAGDVAAGIRADAEKAAKQILAEAHTDARLAKEQREKDAVAHARKMREWKDLEDKTAEQIEYLKNEFETLKKRIS